MTSSMTSVIPQGALELKRNVQRARTMSSQGAHSMGTRMPGCRDAGRPFWGLGFRFQVGWKEATQNQHKMYAYFFQYHHC